MEERLVELFCLACPYPSPWDHLDARLFQVAAPIAHHNGVWIEHSAVDPRNAGGNDRLGTGRRTPVMGTWFQGCVQGGSARRLTCHGKCYGLGMWTTRRLRRPLSHDLTVTHHHRANRRIRASPPQHGSRQFQRPLLPPSVLPVPEGSGFLATCRATYNYAAFYEASTAPSMTRMRLAISIALAA